MVIQMHLQHDFVFIEDAATACIMLGETAGSYGEVWHVPGAGPITGRRLIDMAFKAAGKKPNIGVLSERMIREAGQLDAEVQELIELMYEFEEPLVLDGSKFPPNFLRSSILLTKKELKRQFSGIKTSINIMLFLFLSE